MLDNQGAYLCLGHHLGRWTPYPTVAKRWRGTADDFRAAGTPIAPIVNRPLDARIWDTGSVSGGVS